MKYLFSFTVVCCLLLSACTNTTEPSQGFPTDARDFLPAGGVGSELVFLQTRTTIDTNGTKTISPSDTIIWKVLRRDIPNAAGEMSVTIYGKYVKAGASTPSKEDTMYFSSNSSGITISSKYMDPEANFVLKNPLSVNAQWTNINAYQTGEGIHIIMSLRDTITTPLKQFITIRQESQRTFTYSSIIYKDTIKNYFSPEVHLARVERFEQQTYRSNKIDTRTTITDLIRYTKK